MFSSIRFRAIFYTAIFCLGILLTARLSQVLFNRSIIISAFEEQIHSRFVFLYSVVKSNQEIRSVLPKNGSALERFDSLTKHYPEDALQGKIVQNPTHFFWAILDQQGDPRDSQSLPEEFPTRDLRQGKEKTWCMVPIGNVNFLAIHQELPSGDTLIVGGFQTDLAYTLNYLLFLNFSFGIIVILLVIICVWFIFRRVFQPLEIISKIAQKIGAGKVSSRIHIPDIDIEIRPVGQSLNDMLDRLEQTIEGHARFNSEVSHEILTPLNRITSILNKSIEKQITGEDLNANLLDCQSLVLKTSTLASDLLELARSESASSHTHISMDLEPAIDQAIVDVEPLADEKGMTIELESSTVGILGNPMQMHQVIMNLLTNAIKYAPDHSTIRVTLTKKDNQSEVSVFDCGPGVCPTEIGKLFHRFFRTQSARQDQKMGYGLGLAICKNLIDQHKGKIGYERTAEGLTRFFFTLPLLTS